MKKVFSLVILFFAFLICGFTFHEVLDNQKVCFDKKTDRYMSYSEGCYALVKKTNSGSGSYSEYYDENNNLFYMPSSSYEFFAGEKFIGFNNDELKFYEIKGKNSRLLSKDEVKNIFPDYEIILISEFDRNKKYKLKNSLFKSKKILILNDTNRTFHKFFVYPESSRNSLDKNSKSGMIKSIVTVYGKKNVRLKHFGGDEFEVVVQ